MQCPPTWTCACTDRQSIPSTTSSSTHPSSIIHSPHVFFLLLLTTALQHQRKTSYPSAVSLYSLLPLGRSHTSQPSVPFSLAVAAEERKREPGARVRVCVCVFLLLCVIVFGVSSVPNLHPAAQQILPRTPPSLSRPTIARLTLFPSPASQPETHPLWRPRAFQNSHNTCEPSAPSRSIVPSKKNLLQRMGNPP